MCAEKKLGCIECGEFATWIRRTQFSGDHPFCTKHAEKESNFGKSDPSYFFWEELPIDKVISKHKTKRKKSK